MQQVVWQPATFARLERIVRGYRALGTHGARSGTLAHCKQLDASERAEARPQRQPRRHGHVRCRTRLPRHKALGRMALGRVALGRVPVRRRRIGSQCQKQRQRGA